ncbi:S8 family peptidase [Candidatus Woesearchaeota archaeon]|nr:S8 family peptidase [Candidatus Woesearchaeota archaeon]
MEEDGIITMHDDLKVIRLEKGKLEEKEGETKEMHRKLGIPEAKELIKNKLRQKGLSAEEAEAVSEGEGVHIALLNSGIDENHPGIEGKLAKEKGRNCVPWLCIGTKDEYTHLPDEHHDKNDISSKQVHGLSVGGIITNSRFGILRNAKLHVVKVCDDNRHGSQDTVLSGLGYIYSKRETLDLVNMSIGFRVYQPQTTARIFRSCERLAEEMMMVSAAGNEGYGPSIPSTSNCVISVGATCYSKTDPDYHTVCEFSNVWPTIDVTAPGKEILCLDTKKPGETDYRDAYGMMTGTSAATPIITSILGLAIAYIKKRNQLEGVQERVDCSDLEKRLKSTAHSDKIRPFGFDTTDEQIEDIFGRLYTFHLINTSLGAADFKRFAAGAGRVDAAEILKSVIEDYD